MFSNSSDATGLSASMRKSLLAAWFQEHLPFLLSDPDELDTSESKEEEKVN